MKSKTSKRELLSGGVASILQPSRRQEPTGNKPADEGREPLNEGARPEKNETPIFQTRGRRGGWKKSRNYVTSFVFDEDQYNELRRISYDYRLSLKETLYRVVKLGLDALAKDSKAILYDGTEDNG